MLPGANVNVGMKGQTMSQTTFLRRTFHLPRTTVGTQENTPTGRTVTLISLAKAGKTVTYHTVVSSNLFYFTEPSLFLYKGKYKRTDGYDILH